jgi:hypothetical protein
MLQDAADALGILGIASGVPALIKTGWESDMITSISVASALDRLGPVGFPRLNFNVPVTKLDLNHLTQYEVRITNQGDGPAWLDNFGIWVDDLKVFATQEIDEALPSEESWNGTIEITSRKTIGNSIPLNWMIKFLNVEGQLQIDGAFKVEVQDTKAASITTTHGDIIHRGGIKQEEVVILQKVSNNDAEEPPQETKTFGF